MKVVNFKIIIFFIFFATNIYSQKHDNVWFLGHEQYPPSTRFDFDINPIMTDTCDRNLPMHRSSVSISDSLGNLLFYSNSIRIFNRNYQLMQNGDNINPGQTANDFLMYGYPIAEGAIIIPHPKQANKYYLFHQSWSSASVQFGLAEFLRYSLIDMNANNGLGQVELKNQILVSDSICAGQLKAVQHGNGKDWWLLQAVGGNSGFYTFLITEDTIMLTQKQYVGNNNRFAGWEFTGQAVFSPDGTKYARYDYKNDLDIFDFDRCTGNLSNPLHIPVYDSVDIITTLYQTIFIQGGGVAISPNNRYLYVASVYDLYQFDLWSSNIAASKFTVAHYDYFKDTTSAPGFLFGTYFGFLQLAPDNMIYGFADNTKYLHLIKFPDLGISCDVRQHEIFLHHQNGFFLPNFPHYRTGILAGSSCDTLTSITNTFTTTPLNINLYPNPANTNITLESSTPLKEGTIIEIYNTIGQVLFQQKITHETTLLDIDIRSLIDGVYIVQIQKDKQLVSKIFVVSKK